MKKITFMAFVFLIFSCDYFQLQENKAILNKPIAKVYNAKLYKQDIKNLFPKKILKNDSIILAKSIIENWAIKQLLLSKAEENSTKKDNTKVNELVKKYRESLLINDYKEKLVKQQLDTIISNDEIEVFYNKNKQNFKLNEDLVKVRYIYFSNDLIDKKETIKLFRSGNLEDLEQLEKQQLSFKLYHLNDSVWLSLDNVLLKIPYSKEKLLKKTKFIQKEDSLGLYLIAVKDVLKRNDIAPLSYISSTIRQVILHKRKLGLIREIEKIIIKDAVQDKNFKIY